MLILGAVFFGLLLFSQVRVGGTVVYAEQGLQILIRVGPLRIRVFPVKKKKERPFKSAKEVRDNSLELKNKQSRRA